MRYDARYESARATCQSRRGWDFPPEPAEPAFSIIRVLEVLFRPATMISLGALALCVVLLVMS